MRIQWRLFWKCNIIETTQQVANKCNETFLVCVSLSKHVTEVWPMPRYISIDTKSKWHAALQDTAFVCDLLQIKTSGSSVKMLQKCMVQSSLVFVAISIFTLGISAHLVNTATLFSYIFGNQIASFSLNNFRKHLSLLTARLVQTFLIEHKDCTVECSDLTAAP